MPHLHSKRIQVELLHMLPYIADGTADFYIVDTTDGQVICRHRFNLPTHKGPLDTPDWYEAQKKIAQAIADALNAAPNAAIEYIRQTQREAHHLREMAEKQL